MSRIPIISTPGRPSIASGSGAGSGSSGSGLPTPTARRARSSLGPSAATSSSAALHTPDTERDEALRELLRTRPPSGIKNSSPLDGEGDPDSPTPTPSLAPPSAYPASLGRSTGIGLGVPRTPGIGGTRPKTPSGLGMGQPSTHAPTTPSASRLPSRASVSGRPSISGVGGAAVTPRRTSMASSTTTPSYARRPESRASTSTNYDAIAAKAWKPVIGDHVKLAGMGMEGILRYVGKLGDKEGTWAGVELEGGFVGRGKNSGDFEGAQYFPCQPLCGMFVMYTRILRPDNREMSRPASVASQHSLASSHASFSIHGRNTPSISGRVTPSLGRSTATTPARNRIPTISKGPTIAEQEDRPQRTMLGTSTSSNAAIEGKITAGSRASKYVGMTAKQLESAKAGNLNASVRNLGASTTTTPKPNRMSLAGPTPARGPRQSLGNSLVTPRPKAPRASNAHDMMPPPPSPSNINRVVQAHQAQLEEEIRDLRAKNAEMEQQLRDLTAGESSHNSQGARSSPVNGNGSADLDILREEANSLRNQLSASQADAADASRLAEELQAASVTSAEELQSKESALRDIQKELRLSAERASAELDAAMQAKGSEVKGMRERAEKAELENQSFSRLVEELSEAGQATIALYESEKFKLDDKIRNLEDKLAKVREERDIAQDTIAAQATADPETRAREAATAAEIDNETLNAQIKHLQNKINHLEEDLEEARSQAESDIEAYKAKLGKSRDGEKLLLEQVQGVKAEVVVLKEQATGAKGRIGELEGALKENQVALEGARAEIETLRVDAGEASSLRIALQNANATEKSLAERETEIASLKSRVSELSTYEDQAPALQARITALETEIAALKAKAEMPALPTPPKPRTSTSGVDVDADKRIRGFQHIIQELSAENVLLKEKYDTLLEEAALLKEEVKLLEETGEGAISTANGQDLEEARATIEAHMQNIKDLNREVSELESLIESKIYREDELETRATELERELQALRRESQHLPQANGTSAHSRQSSMHTNGTEGTDGDGRCELCEGPHDLDACPVFAGNMEAVPGTGKTRKFCADCESTEHDTPDCPLADDVF